MQKSVGFERSRENERTERYKARMVRKKQDDGHIGASQASSTFTIKTRNLMF